jgi:hypothetical protein
MAKFPPLDSKTADFLREVCQALEKNAEWMDTPEGREFLRTPRAQPADDRWHTPDVKPSQFLIPSGWCLVKYKHGGYDTWGTHSPAWANPVNISFWMPVPMTPGGERLEGPPVVSTETRTRRGNQIRDVVMSAIENRPLPGQLGSHGGSRGHTGGDFPRPEPQLTARQLEEAHERLIRDGAAGPRSGFDGFQEEENPPRYEITPDEEAGGMRYTLVHTTTEPPRTHTIPNPAPVDRSFIARARRAYESLMEQRQAEGN